MGNIWEALKLKQTNSYSLSNELISQKESEERRNVLQGNLGVVILLLAIPENPHRLFIFLGVRRAVRTFGGWRFQEHQ